MDLMATMKRKLPWKRNKENKETKRETKQECLKTCIFMSAYMVD